MGKKLRVNQDADGFDIPDESLKCLNIFSKIFSCLFSLNKNFSIQQKIKAKLERKRPKRVEVFLGKFNHSQLNHSLS